MDTLDVRRQAYLNAVAWIPTLEQSKGERIIEIRFGLNGVGMKSFVSPITAHTFEDFLEKSNVPYWTHVYDLGDYGRIR